MYKLVATDLDGTLLQNGIRTIREDVYDAIKEYVKKGGIFLPASGRQYYSVYNLFKPVAEDIAYICENGCLVFYKGELIHKETMDRQMGISIIREIESIEGAEVNVSGVYNSYIKPKDEYFGHYIKDIIKNRTEIVDDLANVPEDYFKISAYSPEGVEVFEQRLKEKFGSYMNVVTSGNCWTDIMPKGVHKASGLAALDKRLSIGAENMAAMGDHYNDYELLSYVGHAFCVDNAKPEIKALCEGQMECGYDLLIKLVTV